MRGCPPRECGRLQKREAVRAEAYFPGSHGATRGQGFLWSPPQLSRWSAMKCPSPFSNILRTHGFLPSSFYFLPWLLLAAASRLPRAERQPGRAPGGTAARETSEVTETGWSKALNPRALSHADFRFCSYSRGVLPSRTQRPGVYEGQGLLSFPPLSSLRAIHSCWLLCLGMALVPTWTPTARLLLVIPPRPGGWPPGFIPEAVAGPAFTRVASELKRTWS